jgi:cell wall-associated NlpC family hydrolase
MADVNGMLNSAESALAKIYGWVDKSESKVASIVAMGSKFAESISKVTSGSRQQTSARAGSGGNLMENSLGNVPEFQAQGAAGGGTGGAGVSGGGSGGGATVSASASGPSSWRPAAIAAGAASTLYNITPGTSDAFAMQGALFPTAFAATGPYDKKAVGERIIQGIGVGASSTTDPAAAAALAAARFFVFSEGDRSVDNMLKGAEFAHVMTGMANPTALVGMTDIYRGGSGVNDRLLSMGVSQLNADGSLRDLGEIVNELLKRGNIDNMTEEEFNKSMAMGFMGQTFSYAFGDSPELYSQAAALARAQVKSGNQVLRYGDGSALEAAYGMGREESPYETISRTTSNQFEALVNWSEEIRKGADFMSHFNSGLAKAIDILVKVPIIGPVFGMGKGAWDALAGNFRSTGGDIVGRGSTAHDSVKAVLAPGEYVLNARAASLIGKDALDDMNSLGHEFGSGFASPAPVFLSKGGSASTGNSVNGSQVANLASQYVGRVPYIPSHLIRNKGKSPGPENGWDCSTFVQWVYGQFGVKTPGYSDNFLGFGNPVNKENLQPGDILVWNTMSDRTAGHVSIYAGNGEHVHAANKDAGTIKGKISDWYWSRFLGARRADTDALSAPTEDVGSSPKPEPGITDLLAGVSLASAFVSGDRARPFTAAVAFSLPGLSGVNGMMGPVVANADAVNYASTSYGTSLSASSSVGEDDEKSWFESGGLSLLNRIRGFFGLGDSSNSSSGGSTQTGNTQTSQTGTVASSDTDEERRNFATRILQGIGAPTTGTALKAMLEWMRHEGGHYKNNADFNPLNTTQKMPGDGPMSSKNPKIRSYGNWEDGVAATLRTITSDKYGYPKIVQAFRENKDLGSIYRAINKSQWGTKTLPGYAHGTEYVSGDQVANLHQGELVMPAAQAQMFRMALQEALSGARRGPEQVNVTLNIERASDEEAERFARKVVSIVRNEEKHDRLATL